MRAVEIGGLAGGVKWCTVHSGVRNEDECGECDMADWYAGSDEQTACEFHELHWSVEVAETVEPERDEDDEDEA